VISPLDSSTHLLVLEASLCIDFGESGSTIVTQVCVEAAIAFERAEGGFDIDRAGEYSSKVLTSAKGTTSTP
jgi:hypothetical protein